jgi:hypothetical protein
VRITNTGGGQPGVRRETACVGEALCASGAVRGRTEVIVRVVGPRPNGRLWPTLVRFTTSRVEVWIRQVSSGLILYYDLPALPSGDETLAGLVDRQGFAP